MDLYVANIPPVFNEDHLFGIFSLYGEVTKVKIMREWGTRKSRGFGFVGMDCAKQAAHAAHQLNGKVILDRKLVVQKAFSKEDETEKTVEEILHPKSFSSQELENGLVKVSFGDGNF